MTEENSKRLLRYGFTEEERKLLVREVKKLTIDAVMNQDVHDHSNWKKIVDAYPVETIDEEQMIPTRLAMGRYIKVMVAGSAQVEGNNGSMKACIAEIKAYGKN